MAVRATGGCVQKLSITNRAAQRSDCMGPSRRQLIAAYVLSATAVVVTASAGVLYAETASVKLSIAPQRLEANVTLTGGQAPGDLHTQRIQVSFTDSQQGTASLAQVSAIYASGQVVFTCSPCQMAPLIIPQGTIVSTTKALGYATVLEATITNSTGSTSVAVRATAAGAGWNTGSNTITTIANSPDASLQVTNPEPITGGANERSAQVIQQSDFDAVRGALTANVNNHLAVALMAKAQALSYIADPLPVISLRSDHNVGDETPTFTVTITVTLGAFAFSGSEAQALLRSALMARVPSYEALTSDPIRATYQIQQVSSNGDIVVIGKAAGCVVPKLSQRSFGSQIKGLSPAQAAQSLQRTVPGSTVAIQISPSALPVLPLVAQHISFNFVVEPGLDPIYSLNGTVPADATSAVVGVRVNEEGAGPGKADFTISEMAYRQNGESRNRVPNPDFANGLQDWGLPAGTTLVRPTGRCAGTVLHMTATSDQSIQMNSSEFPVAAGAPFTTTFVSHIPPASVGSGYFAIFFFFSGSHSPNTRGDQRVQLPFTATPTS